MDTSAAPTPASPPAKPVNGRLRLEFDLAEVAQAQSLDEVLKLMHALLAMAKALPKPVGTLCSLSILGKVYTETLEGEAAWERALLFNTLLAQSRAPAPASSSAAVDLHS